MNIKRAKISGLNILGMATAALAAALLVACGAPGPEPPPTAIATSTTAVSPTQTHTASTITAVPTIDLSLPTQEAAPTATSTLPQAGETQTTIATATIASDNPPVSTDVIGSNVFKFILGEAVAPEGYSVQPCEWDAPVLCVLSGSEIVGQIELFMSHVETLPEFQEMLAKEGLSPGSIDHQDSGQASGIVAALRTFVEGYHKTFEEDRRLTHGDEATYKRLDTQEALIAEMRGLRYGFVVHDKKGKVLERWISFAAFDGNILYIMVPHYDPRSHMSFRTDEEVQQVEPYMRQIVAGLTLPLPIVETDVKQIVTLATVPVFRFYGNGSNPIAEVPAGQALTVTGRTPDARAWRVVCPNSLTGECWISAHPSLAKPAVP